MPLAARQPTLYQSGMEGAGTTGRVPGAAVRGGKLSGGMPFGCGSSSASVIVIVGGIAAGAFPVLSATSVGGPNGLERYALAPSKRQRRSKSEKKKARSGVIGHGLIKEYGCTGSSRQESLRVESSQFRAACQSLSGSTGGAGCVPNTWQVARTFAAVGTRARAQGRKSEQRRAHLRRPARWHCRWHF